MLKYMDGFDQFQGQAGNALLTSLTSLGYTPAPGMAMAAGRHPSTWALELQVTAGSAGTSWSSRPNNIAQTLNGVCHTGVRWVAVGTGGIAAVSDDSQSWQPVVTGSTAVLRDVAAGNGRVIAVGPTGVILVSPEGLTWQQVNLPRPGITLNQVGFAEGVFIMVGQEGSTGVIFRTTDGTDIDQVAANIPSAMQSVAFGNGKWMAGGANGVMRVSTDATGSLWTPRLLQAGTAVLALACGEDGVWLAGQGRSIYRSLNDGENWVVSAPDLAPLNMLIQRIRYSSGLWVVIVNNGRIFSSGDALGETFTSRFNSGNTLLYGLAFSTGVQGGWVAVGRVSGASAFIGVSVSPPTTISRTFSTTANRLVIGFAHRATARGRILEIAGLLTMDWPRGIEILGVEGTAVPIRNVWYYYEILIDKASNKIELWINDHLDLTVPLPAAAQTMTDYVIRWQAENGAVARIDDLILLDSDDNGGTLELVDRIGPVQIPILRPTEDVITEFEVVPPGSPNHWSVVGQLPPSTSSFIRSSVSGKKDIFTSSDPLPEDAGTEDVPIFAVGIMALAQKSDLDARQLGLVIGTGEGQREIIDDELATTWEYSLGVFEKGPADAPWDETNIEALPFGVAVRP